MSLGLYIHIPFCLGKCRYCDFYSGKSDENTHKRYEFYLKKHLALKAPSARGEIVDTVYFGGGTPTVLPPQVLSSILAQIKTFYTLSPTAEITVECNPATQTEAMMEGLLEGGFNRLSIGLQSIHDAELKALGRLHDAAAFLHTFRAARKAGFQNISADVMFGIPHQTKDSLAATLDTLMALSPQHISAYGLRIEEGTPFYRMKESLPLPDDDTVADMQEQIADTLKKNGWEHYEISNYAREGFRSRHNMRYWLGTPYLGFGPGAHSYFEGIRFAAPRDLEGYMEALEKGDLSSVETERTPIRGKEAQDEYVMLRMRLFEGVDEGDFSTRFGTSFEKAYGPFDTLIKGNFLKREHGRVAFTERGMFVSNSILSDWLDFGLS